MSGLSSSGSTVLTLASSVVCFKADYSDISLLMPSSFAEVWLRVYTKDGAFHGLIQAAYRHILKQLVSSEPHGVLAQTEEAQEDGFDPDVLGGPTAAVGGEDDLDLPSPIKLWRPGSAALGDSPSTPRMLAPKARNFSTGSLASASGLGSGSAGGSRLMGRASSFSENQFTAVPPNFRGESPTRKPKSKRGRVVSDIFDGGRPRKSARMSEKGADAS